MNTSYAMFLHGNSINFSNPTDMVDDDYFMKILQSDESWEVAKKKYPSLINSGYPPNEIHGMYHTHLDLVVTGARASDFVLDLTWDAIIDRIKDGQVIMTSGTFPEANLSGHAFCIIGFGSRGGETYLLLADPWGNYRTAYTNYNGYCVPMSRSDFDRIVKPTRDLKWGHVPIWQKRMAA
jgi:hypothetical protein